MSQITASLHELAAGEAEILTKDEIVAELEALRRAEPDT